ncbi:hypothetical protein COP2_026725 [Malus domestica]
MRRSMQSDLQSKTNPSNVQAKLATSEGMRNERMQNWTSSGKSEKEMARPGSLVARWVRCRSRMCFSSRMCFFFWVARTAHLMWRLVGSDTGSLDGEGM